MSALKEQVQQALERVVDPCSITAGAPISVVDMGMINAVSVDAEGGVDISMRATSAMCTMIAGIMQVVEREVGGVEGVSEVRVELTSGSLWTEAEMTERGRRILGERRQRSRKEVPVVPYELRRREAQLRAASSEAR